MAIGALVIDAAPVAASPNEETSINAKKEEEAARPAEEEIKVCRRCS